MTSPENWTQLFIIFDIREFPRILNLLYFFAPAVCSYSDSISIQQYPNTVLEIPGVEWL